MLKAAGSMCVLAACIGFVRELLRTGSLHKEYLEALIELTELLSAEIRYERLPIQEALQQIQKKIRPEIAFVLRQMIEQMKDGTGTPFSEIWEQAFRKHYRKKFGKDIVFDYRAPGGTSDIMRYRKTSWISGPETAGGAFAGMSGTAAASAEIKAEGTGGKETYVPLSGGGSRDFCDSDSGLVIYGEDSDGCQFIV